MVVSWLIEEFFVGCMHFDIIFRKLDIEVWNPTEFTIDISVLVHLRPFWHPSTSYLIQLIRIRHLLRLLSYGLIHSVAFVKILLKR